MILLALPWCRLDRTLPNFLLSGASGYPGLHQVFPRFLPGFPAFSFLLFHFFSTGYSVRFDWNFRRLSVDFQARENPINRQIEFTGVSGRHQSLIILVSPVSYLAFFPASAPQILSSERNFHLYSIFQLKDLLFSSVSLGRAGVDRSSRSRLVYFTKR